MIHSRRYCITIVHFFLPVHFSVLWCRWIESNNHSSMQGVPQNSTYNRDILYTVFTITVKCSASSEWKWTIWVNRMIQTSTSKVSPDIPRLFHSKVLQDYCAWLYIVSYTFNSPTSQVVPYWSQSYRSTLRFVRLMHKHQQQEQQQR